MGQKKNIIIEGPRCFSGPVQKQKQKQKLGISTWSDDRHTTPSNARALSHPKLPGPRVHCLFGVDPTQPTQPTLRSFLPSHRLSPFFSAAQTSSSTRSIYLHRTDLAFGTVDYSFVMTTATPMDDLPLDAQFLHAVTLFNRTSNSWPAVEQLALLSSSPSPLPPSSSTASSTNSEAALGALSTVAAAAHGAGLLSSNEDVEEIATGDLKYLLLPLLAAGAHEDSHPTERSERLDHLEAASVHLCCFFRIMDGLRLLRRSDRAQVLPNEDEGESEATTAIAVQGAGALREEKIRRLKAEKEVECKLWTLLSKNRKECDEDGDDEENRREISLTLLQGGVLRGLNLHGCIERESQLLRWAQRQSSKGMNGMTEGMREEGGKKKPPLPVAGIPHHTFRVVSQREKEREGVFKASHSLPTYTVEEWGEIEAKQAASRQRGEDIRAKRAEKEKENEDSDGDEAVDRKRKEDAAWDDWKDQHNAGSGNTLR